MKTRCWLSCALLLGTVQAVTWTIPAESWISSSPGGAPNAFGKSLYTTAQWGLEWALNQSNTPEDLAVEFELLDNYFSVARGLEILIQINEAGNTFSAGNQLSSILSVTGQAAQVYGVAQISGTANSAVLSDKNLYPFVSRSYVPSQFIAGGTIATILHFFEQEGRGWNNVALLTSAEAYGISLANTFIDDIRGTPIELATYQQFLPDGAELEVEMREIARSGARVIVVYAARNYDKVLAEARRSDLINDKHVFLCGSFASGTAAAYSFANGTINPDGLENLRGNLGSQAFVNRTGVVYEDLLKRWTGSEADWPGSGLDTVPTLFPSLTYDMGIAVALTVIEAHKQGFEPSRPPSAEQWTEIIRALRYQGATGVVRFNEKGDRPMPISLVNFQPEQEAWVPVGIWEEEEGVTLLPEQPIIWNDNTTNVPDLDVRPAFHYWSCDERKMGYDATGKKIKRHEPNGESFDDIDSKYFCDAFIDCHNFSDESYDGCDTNWLAVFIVFGIVTGLLILLTCCLIPFVLIFGFVLKRKRVRASSPPFLMVIVLTSILGLASTFSWYGKPHPVACGFQPWLLGLSVVSLISALSAKTWRMWRIFRVRFVQVVVSDWKLLGIYAALMVPAVLILVIWTIVSTPTAAMVERDGTEHYVCTTGGFTGTPGGLVFFFILVGYGGLVLLFGMFLSIVTRNIPSFFNESQLMAVSIYNLAFLSVVVIPVFLVLQEFNPFAAWIIRTLAILYAFTATLVLQFLPKLVGVFIIDKGGDADLDSIRKETVTQLPSSGDTPDSSGK